MPNAACHETYRTSAARRGLTLMELVVVLGILTAMAAAAAVATERVIHQRRFELTRDTLQALQRATLGRFAAGESPQSAARVEGFVADVGRLPRAVGNAPALQAAELWSNPLGMEPYGFKPSPLDSEVWLACGWRGPYLDLPPGQTQLLDGWGRPLQALTTDANHQPAPAIEGQPIAGWLSLGSDGAPGVAASSDPTPLAEDLSVWFGAGEVSKWTANIRCTVWQRNEHGERVIPTGSGLLVVRLFGPHPETGGVATIEPATQIGPFVQPPVFEFVQVPLGTKVLRAYYDEAGPTELRSAPQTVEISRTGLTHFQLVLPMAAVLGEEQDP